MVSGDAKLSDLPGCNAGVSRYFGLAPDQSGSIAGLQVTDELSNNEHLTFYLDLLGTTAGILSLDEAQGNKLVGLLTKISLLSGAFDLQKKITESGPEYNVRSEITTFSDHVVISYPTKAILSMSDDLGTGLYLAERIISGLASEAIKLGFLIRGGATVGRLHHRGGVVVGPALIEAYKLESTVSIYPRISVSRKVYSQVKSHSVLLTVDDDGITYFDYFLPMIARHAAGPQGNEFISNSRSLINQNIETFEGHEKWNEMAKWVWFEKKFDRAVAEIREVAQNS